MYNYQFATHESMAKSKLVTVVLLVSILTYGQDSRWLLQKEGKWRFENHLPEKAYKMRNATLSVADNLTFRNKIATLAEWFRQHHPMLKSPKGYDLRALSGSVWGDFTTKSDAEYGIPASMGFLFEIFDSDGGKWTVEPPQYAFEINAIDGGHDGRYFTPESVTEDGKRYDLSQSEAVSKALQKMTEFFPTYPLKAQPCPGVDVYEAGGRQKIVVYNPQRPPFWIPVTVKEMADAHLSYYALFQKEEIDRMVLGQLKQEIAELSPEELAAPAYSRHNTHFVLKVNGKRNGLQIMRFNPSYWDRTLPISAIQLMTFWNACHTEKQMAEQQKRSYPDYPQLFVNQIEWDKIANLIQKKQ